MHAERLRDPRQRAERAARILDAAAGLLLRYGYRRVTIDDVAAEAQVGKGTVYLHWKTREQLFSAVFQREVLCAIDQLRQAIRNDPQVCLLHRFARAYYLAIVQRPLLRGFLLADPGLLGKLAASRDTAHEARHRAMSRRYLEPLAKHGLLRDDMNLEDIGYAYQATFEGFLQQEAAAPADGLELRAQLLARTIRRAFESDRVTSDSELREIAAATITLLTDLIDTDQADTGIPRA